MRARLLATIAGLALLPAAGAWAQATPNTASAETTAGVTAYPAAFYAANTPISALDMVQRTPGFSFDGGSAVRGFGGAAGNVLIDGRRPTSKSDPLEDIVRRIPASQVERIEIIRGGAPGIDMQGQAIVANVVRRTDSRGQTLFAVASGYYQDGRTTPAMRFEGSRRLSGDRTFEWSILKYQFVDDSAGEGPLRYFDQAGNLLQDGYTDQTGGGGGLTTSAGWRQPLWGGELALNGRVQLEKFDASYEDTLFTPPASHQIVNDLGYQPNAEFGLNWERALGPSTRLELIGLQRLRRNRYDSTFSDGVDSGRFVSDADSGESIGRAVLHYTRSPRWTLEGGGEVAFNALESTQSFDLNGAPVTLPSANVRVEELRAEGFGTSTFQVSPRLSFELGLRLETSTISETGDVTLERSFFYPKPRASVTWTPWTGNQFRFRLERVVGQLSFGDFVSSNSFASGIVTAGNAQLEPDKTWLFEAAYERSFWDSGAVTFTYRHKAITDALDRIPVIGPGYAFDAPGNIGDGISDELTVDLTLPMERLGLDNGLLRGTLEYWRSEVTDPTTGATRRISNQAPLQLQLHFTKDEPALKLQWGWDYYLNPPLHAYAFDNVSTQDAEDWYTVFVDFKPQPNLSIRFEVQNLSGRNFLLGRDVHAGPRNSAPFLYREVKDLNFDPFLYFRIRKVWG